MLLKSKILTFALLLNSKILTRLLTKLGLCDWVTKTGSQRLGHKDWVTKTGSERLGQKDPVTKTQSLRFANIFKIEELQNSVLYESSFKSKAFVLPLKTKQSPCDWVFVLFLIAI